MSKKFWVLTSVFLFMCIIILKIYHYGTDISLYPLKNVNRSYTDQKIWFISYANKGVYIQNQNNLIMSATMYQLFDRIIPYQPHHIEPEYYNKHKDILSQKRGAGYWLWKPYFILKTLKMMPENDILFYVDSSSVFKDGIYQLLELGKQYDITVFPNFHTNRQYMKKAIIDKIMNGDESIRDKTQLEGSLLVLKNTVKTRNFVEEWLRLCEDPELLTDIPSENGEYQDLLDHRHDQAILTALYYKNPQEYNLYKPYPARMDSVIITRRKRQCSMRPITFNDKTEFSWLDGLKYRSIIWLIGCQRFKGD